MLKRRKLIAFRIEPQLWSALKALAKEQDTTLAKLAEAMLSREPRRTTLRALQEK